MFAAPHVSDPKIKLNIPRARRNLNPYQTTLSQDGHIVLSTGQPPRLRIGGSAKAYAWSKLIFIILGNVYAGGRKTKSKDLTSIIEEIHYRRFDPANPYLISGDHYTQLYLRSLGIFYHSILDPRTALSDTDWFNRQAIVIKTVAFALDVYSKNPTLTTTIAPIGKKTVVPINVFTPPSDSLYSLLFALKSLIVSNEITQIYPFPGNLRKLQTATTAEHLLSRHKTTLQRHLEFYTKTVFDPVTGLVKKQLVLSGTKDSAKRQCSLYDNIILWKTHVLAQELKLEKKESFDTVALKQRIINTFWLPDRGYFLEDLSTQATHGKHYSSDWLIVLMTGFLNPQNSSERKYFERSISYIKETALDFPFPLKYHSLNRKQKTRFPVSLLLPSYVGEAIWSNWGMEYIKLLLIMYQETRKNVYLRDAKKHLAAYVSNIQKTRGYPEVYSPKGKLLRNPFYQSVRQTGWVVSFEQALAMCDAVDHQA